MISFYEMLEFVENDWLQELRGKDREDAASNARSQFASDQMSMDTGDHGVERRSPIIPNRPARTISSADDMMRSRGIARLQSNSKGTGIGLRQGDIKDVGKHLDGPTVGKGHWVGKPDTGFDPGAAEPRRTLQRSQKDVTGAGGRDDVSISTDRFQNANARREMQIRNQMNPSQNNYSSQNREWDQELEKKMDSIVQLDELDSPHTEKEIIALLKWNQEVRKRPGVSEDLKSKTYDVDAAVYKMLESKPIKEKPEDSPMAKYMMRKHSNVF